LLLLASGWYIVLRFLLILSAWSKSVTLINYGLEGVGDKSVRNYHVAYNLSKILGCAWATGCSALDNQRTMNHPLCQQLRIHDQCSLRCSHCRHKRTYACSCSSSATYLLLSPPLPSPHPLKRTARTLSIASAFSFFLACSFSFRSRRRYEGSRSRLINDTAMTSNTAAPPWILGVQGLGWADCTNEVRHPGLHHKHY
jgi:hypothetical protein